MLWGESVSLASKTASKRASMEALKKCENDPFVVLAIASLFAREHKIEKARKWYERSVTLQPDHGDAWATWYKFETLQARRGDKDAVPDAVRERCIRASPRHGFAWAPIAKSVPRIEPGQRYQPPSSGDILERVSSALNPF